MQMRGQCQMHQVHSLLSRACGLPSVNVCDLQIPLWSGSWNHWNEMTLIYPGCRVRLQTRAVGDDLIVVCWLLT